LSDAFMPSTQTPIDFTSRLFRQILKLLVSVSLSAIWQASNAAESTKEQVYGSTLEVQAFTGDRCEEAKALPENLPVWAIKRDGQWLIWEGMAPMRPPETPANSPNSPIDLLPWTHTEPLGQAVWLRQEPTLLSARWQERPVEKGCAFTDARLQLSAWTEEPGSPTSAHLVEHQRLLAQALDQLTHLQSATTLTEVKLPLSQLDRLLLQTQESPTAGNDRNLALIWLQVGERASAFRQHSQAVNFFHGALTTYEAGATQGLLQPQDAALPLSSLARAQARSGKTQDAMASVARAMSLLEQHQGAQTPAASSLHNQAGALLLNQRKARQALESFSKALQVDEARQAPATERVSTLMNSAVALEELDQHSAARAIYVRCQQLLSEAPKSDDNDQLSHWVDSRLQALSPSRVGATVSL
jgi:tetratricopeptide (TPR) repeat protein